MRPRPGLDEAELCRVLRAIWEVIECVTEGDCHYPIYI